METIKIKLHSVVDVITNSSTVIYTYQNGSIEPAKELINEMIKLAGIEGKTADDLFTFEIEQEERGEWDNWEPDSYLILTPKDEKYAEFGKKIQGLLGSVTADGGMDN